MPLLPLANIRNRIGEETGVSSWLTLDQARIDSFADSTEDRQFIHIDPEAAAKTPFGGTIAHGFLTLSLLSRMGVEAMALPEGLMMAVNYGLEFGALPRTGSLGQKCSRALRAGGRGRQRPRKGFDPPPGHCRGRG